ncbi:Bug family tripartite tricarboxylate transporter substrate binding protein [Bordetella bronchiseptica]|uniref:Bug family tripartite tricarboxylate transporter substrate binding protein n=1 Tax=Bordetella bronchiseptica TaxID=518 RepID=UPI00028BA1BA|nr:tripartite tricarboxylate transporter substrate binding protein [Bordetella bronchiseptica]KDD54031.1 tripartite tricarboxylate transporter family receptor [Bordetella bronchiseptica OSU553]AWQ07088.1 twin-arginine translocation pathway signal [Bordetella bronchiseptica]KAK52867.1 tripartite tricarboxylate transporter family receptor [Bordetella bronchiseptica OSU054]KDC95018.1 tripartite tricarboxylate transporter family receptor [Bordetella bronchiseptica MBORD675]KDD41177.1 tripartite tr
MKPSTNHPEDDTPRSERRRSLLAGAGGLLAGALPALAPLRALAQAQAPAWPQRPIKLVVPQGPGGGVDIVARLLAPPLGQALGQTVVVENKPGASTNIGAENVVRAAPDGYTVLFGINQTATMNPHIYPNLAFDPLTDLVPVTQTSTVAYVLCVNNELPVRTLDELVAYARQNPGKLSYGTYGAGSAHHLLTEMLSGAAGIQMTQVPYKQPPLTDMMAGRIQVLVDVSAVILPYLRAGSVRPLAYTDARRHPELPDTPTLSETYPELVMVGWHGAWMPKGTPAPIVDRLNAELRQVVQLPEVRQRFAELSIQPTGTSAADFQAIIARDYQRWGAVIRERNIRFE